jgi:hypothetical protein
MKNSGTVFFIAKRFMVKPDKETQIDYSNEKFLSWHLLRPSPFPILLNMKQPAINGATNCIYLTKMF